MWSSRGSAQTRTRRRQSVGVPPMERVAGAFIHLEASGWDSGEQDVLIGAGTERVVGSPNEEDRDSDLPNPGNDIILKESLKHSTPDGRRDFQTLLDNEVEERIGDGLGDRALLKVAGKVCVDGIRQGSHGALPEFRHNLVVAGRGEGSGEGEAQRFDERTAVRCKVASAIPGDRAASITVAALRESESVNRWREMGQDPVRRSATSQ